MKMHLFSTIVAAVLAATLSSVYAWPMAGATPYAYPIPGPSCNGPGSGCGDYYGGECCGGYGCENGACYPIVEYGLDFYGPPRVKGGYGNTFAFGR